MINNSININYLRIPPANRLEKLSGDREGLHSIRINDQWRICFEWLGSDAFNIEEFQEVLGAIDAEDPHALKEELGDLLFQILLYSLLAGERGWFSTREVVDELQGKMIRHNPHVFGSLVLTDLEAVNTGRRSKLGENIERKSLKMYDVNFQQDSALVTVQEQVVTITLDPPPADRFAPGYTRTAWAWLLLNEALDRANIPMPDEDRKEIAILISDRGGRGKKRRQIILGGAPVISTQERTSS